LKTILFLTIFVLLLGAAIFSGYSDSESEEIMVIETDFGAIKIVFFPDKAPNHVAAIKRLVDEGFYNGITFHRVIPGFMIQGGCPNSKDANATCDGTGGPGFNLKAEFNDVPHERGICSMARSSNPDSAGSQFFIMLAPAPHLDGQYTVWGKVIEGMDVVDKIVNVPRNSRDRPLQNVVMRNVYLTE